MSEKIEKSKRIKELVAEIAGASTVLGAMVPNGDKTVQYIMARLDEIIDITKAENWKNNWYSMT